MCPSYRSVIAAMAKIPHAIQRQVVSCPPCANSASRKTGTRISRSTVRAFGRFTSDTGGGGRSVIVWRPRGRARGRLVTVDTAPSPRDREVECGRDQVDAVAAVDPTAHQVTRPQVGRRKTGDRRRSGRCRRRPAPGAVHDRTPRWPPVSTVKPSFASTSTHISVPIRSSARCAVSSSTSERDPLHPLFDDVVVELVGQVLGGGAVLVGIAEYADRIHPGTDQERLELLQVGLGLPGESDDDVGPDPGLRGRGADLFDESEERGPRAVAAHPSQHRFGGVLEGHVVIVGDTRDRRDGLDQPRPGLCRLQVGQPHPGDPGDRRQFAEQILQLTLPRQILAEGGRVLADQHDFPDALLGQPAGLGDDLGDRTGRRTPPGTTGWHRTCSGDRTRRRSSAAPPGRCATGSATASDRTPVRARAATRPRPSPVGPRARSAATAGGRPGCAPPDGGRRRRRPAVRPDRGRRRSRARHRPPAAPARVRIRSARPYIRRQPPWRRCRPRPARCRWSPSWRWPRTRRC